MDAPQRGALTLVRLIGVTLIVWTVFDLGLYLVKCYNPRQRLPVELIPVLLHSIPAVAGIVVLVKSHALADWISNILDL